MKSTSTPSSNGVLLLGVVVVGVPFTVGVVTTVSAIQESAGTEETQGTVVAFERGNTSRGGAVSKPLVDYRVAGRSYRCTGAVASNLPVYSDGDRVTVRYKIQEPGTAFLDSFFDRWLGPLLFTGVGFLFLVVLLIAFVQKIR